MVIAVDTAPSISFSVVTPAESLVMNIHQKQKFNTEVDKVVLDAIIKTYMHDANDNIRKNAIDAVMAFIREDKLDSFIEPIKSFCSYPLQNTKVLRRLIAKSSTENKSYIL